MSGKELKQIRKSHGWSARVLAEKLDLPDKSGRTIRRWEADDTVPGPVALAVRCMVDHG